MPVAAQSTYATFPALDQYLSRLRAQPHADPDTRVWLDADGRAQGRYFNSTLTSAFQPIRVLGTDEVIGFEGFARSYSETDGGLSLWKLLDQAANDDESVELDRLCRMLHAINFFRQPASVDQDLYLSVHARLLAAVEGDHGRAFSHVLDVLGLPQKQVVLQLPVITEYQTWLVNYVADNYRRNGFRIALNASDAADALALLQRVRPEIVKLDCRSIGEKAGSEETLLRLLETASRQGARVIFKRVEDTAVVEVLERIAATGDASLSVQGFIWGSPAASIDGVATAGEEKRLQQPANPRHMEAHQEAHASS